MSVEFVRTHHMLTPVDNEGNFAMIRDDFFQPLITGQVHESQVITRLRFQTWEKRYAEDVFGEFPVTETAFQKVLFGRMNYYNKIASLSDDDVLSVGIAKDAMCRACLVGKHCRVGQDDFTGTKAKLEENLARVLVKKIGHVVHPFREKREYKWEKMIVPLEFNDKNVDTKVNQLLVKVSFLRQAFK